jgi:putative Mg2+ transporter-C (MgtC) family protein
MLDDFLIRCIIAASLGICIGVERAIYHKVASIRTFSLISLGSCIFSIMSLMMGLDPSRIAAQIVSGIGFLGGGVILKNDSKIEGITTAAMMWFASAIGMACGFGYELIASYLCILYVLVLVIGIYLHELIDFFDK